MLAPPNIAKQNAFSAHSEGGVVGRGVYFVESAITFVSIC